MRRELEGTPVPLAQPLRKREAIVLLGGSARRAAAAMGISEQAVSQWPEVLTARLRDRVQAALWRLHVQVVERQRQASKPIGNPNLPLRAE